MKILEIVFNLEPGGAERFAVDLSNELAKQHDVTLLTLKNDKINTEIRNFYKYELSQNVTYDCLYLRDGWYPSMWYEIWRYINNKRPEIVHFHGDTMIYWMFIPICFTSSKIKFVQTIHSDFRWGGYHKGLNRIASLILGRPHKLRYVALSNKNHKDFSSFYPHVLSRCIENGRAPILPTDKYDTVNKEIQGYKHGVCTKTFIHIARFNPVKNQKRLISNFNRLVKLGYDVQLLVLGEHYNDNELGLELQSTACDRIHFLGGKKNVQDYLLNSDIFCLSSDFEGLPITILEALLSGVPIVSTPVCGAVDAIQDGITGILAKDFTDESYLEAMKFALLNLPTLKENTEAQKLVSPYTIKKCADKYIKFFQQ